MSEVCRRCAALHHFACRLPRLHHPLDVSVLPANGVYFVFEQGETGHGVDRVVRVGSHTGQNQLRSRLLQHLSNPSKDRSIFRKNIGRCFLAKSEPSLLRLWNIDLTPKAARAAHPDLVRAPWMTSLESEISDYMQSAFSVAAMEILDKSARLKAEAAIAATVAQCSACCSSPQWLGNNSPVERIRSTGLWQVQGLDGQPVSEIELEAICSLSW